MRASTSLFAALAAAAGFVLLAAAGDSAAVDAPPGFVVENAFPDADFPATFRPVRILFLPDERKLIVDRSGIVYVILADGAKLAVPFIDLRVEVAGLDELGMLGAAVDPDFADNRWVYFGYTVDPDEDGNDEDPGNDRFVRVTRYQESLADPNTADPSSRQVLIGETWPEGIPTLDRSHTIGDLVFASDKSLLLCHGDGAHFDVIDNGGYDPGGFDPGETDPAEDMGSFRARSLNSMCGKILRLDKETGFGLASNPYWDEDPTSDRSRVWIYGLRNAYRFTIRPGTGSTDIAAGDPGVLYVPDVGCCSYEELNIIPGGGVNLGWPCRNGVNPHYAFPGIEETEAGNDSILCSAPLNEENPTPHTDPQLYYHHDDGSNSYPVQGWTGRAIIGGAFYQGEDYPPVYHGAYFVADYVESWIRRIYIDENDNITGYGNFIEDAGRPVNIVADPVSGDLFYASWQDQEVRRIWYDESVAVDESVGRGAAGAPGLSMESFPNPFRHTLVIDFGVPAAGEVSVGVYDLRGRRLRELLPARGMAAGRHILEWDGRDDRGHALESGVYFCRLRWDDRTESAKVVLK